MSKRVYSYYDETTEYKDLENAAKEKGMTISSYQKYATLLLLYSEESKRKSHNSLSQLISDMEAALNNVPSGQTFITSALFESQVWTNLSSSEKRTLAYRLKKIVDNNPKDYTMTTRIPGKINQYKKL